MKMQRRLGWFERAAWIATVAGLGVAALAGVGRAGAPPSGAPAPTAAGAPGLAPRVGPTAAGAATAQVDPLTLIGDLQREVAGLKSRVTALEDQARTHVHDVSTPSVTMVSVPTFRLMLDRNRNTDWVAVSPVSSPSQPQNVIGPTGAPHAPGR